jgi:hypothetical protein
MRCAHAAYTRPHTVLTRQSAMLRAGVLSARAAASTRGSLRKRTPRAACPGPLSPVSSAWGGSGVSSSA